MITKRVFIEVCQDRLSGGDATMDVRGKYDYRVIEQVLSVVFSDIASSDRSLLSAMSYPFVQEVKANKTTLPVRPVLGMKGIVSIEKDGVLIPVSNNQEQSYLMSVLNTQLSSYARFLVGNTLFFQGVEGEVIVNMIPIASDLDEDDNLVVEDMFEVLLGKVLQYMQAQRPKEVKDNSVSDVDFSS